LSIGHWMLEVVRTADCGLRTRDFGLTEDTAEVGIAGLVLDVEAEGVAMKVEFGADDGFDAGFGGGLGEFDGAMEVVGVGKGDGGEFVVFGEFDDGFDGEGGIEEGVVAVEAEGETGRGTWGVERGAWG